MGSDERRDKFVSLAERRVSRVLKDLKLIGNLSNKTNYKYTQSDVKKITSTLKKALADMTSKFERNGQEEEEFFKLD